MLSIDRIIAKLKLDRAPLFPRLTGRRAALLAAVIVFCVFLPSLRNGFVNLDDKEYVLFNPHIRALGGDLLVWAFSRFYADLWIPLTWISLALDYTLWGLNPLGYHLTNVLLHSVNVFWVALLSLELLSACRAKEASEEGWPEGRIMAFVLGCALFYGAHPLRVESVAWVTERKDVLNAFFALPSLLLYLRYAKAAGEAQEGEAKRRLAYGAALALYALSLLSKPITVTWPLVFLILDWFPLGRFSSPKQWARVLAEKIPFLILALGASIVTLVAQRPAMMTIERATPLSRGLVAAKAVIAYLWMTVWPKDILPFHIHPGNVSLFSWEYSLAALLCATLSAAALLAARRHPLFLAAWLSYLVTLSPVLGFFQTGGQAMADRFTYLPAIPVSLLLVTGGTALLPWERPKEGRRGRPRVLPLLAAASILIFYISFTLVQITVWKSPISLWSAVIEARPMQVGMAYLSRGMGYAERGRYEEALQDMNDALLIAKAKNYEKVFEIYYQRALVYRQLGLKRKEADNLSKYRRERAKFESTREERAPP